ncbi:MAG: sulfatase-like hydrolase/transferase [Planctomycetaceae bacterium]|nr:sulfatase-like hydrolase/transferase [Planctomycetaceae bacterium]
MSELLPVFFGSRFVIPVVFFLSGVHACGVQAAERPNILFIFADDQCYQTIGEIVGDEIETPNLDRLVRQGLTFTRTYNMGSWSGAVCVASRTMLNTGRYLWHANRIYNETEQERKAGRFWSEYLRAGGYDTYMTGKWHVKANAQEAFDVTAHVRGGMPAQTPTGYNRPLPDQADPWRPWDQSFGGFWQGGKHWSEVVGDNAVSFLSQASTDDDPFFMYIAFNAPHDPRQSPQEFVDRYPVNEMKLPANFLTYYPFKELIGCGEKLRDERLGPFPRTPEAVQVHRQEYYAIITHMDEQIGRILAALQESGKAENTYVFFTADHGLAVGQHGLFGKQNMYDHSVRVPFMVNGPGIKAGQRCDAPIYLQDVMPTTLELAGIEKPEHVQFDTLMPIIRGEERTSGYDAMYGAYLRLQRMVTMDDYKLILYPKAKVVRLFDLRTDPHEMDDLASDPRQLDRMKRMFARFLELQKETGDQLNIESVFPQLGS